MWILTNCHKCVLITIRTTFSTLNSFDDEPNFTRTAGSLWSGSVLSRARSLSLVLSLSLSLSLARARALSLSLAFSLFLFLSLSLFLALALALALFLERALSLALSLSLSHTYLEHCHGWQRGGDAFAAMPACE